MNNYNGGQDDNNDIRTISIMITTNNNQTSFPLTYSKIVTSYKPDNVVISSDQLPYFAPNKKYPKAYLEGRDYMSILKIFFNRQDFKNEVFDKGEDTKDYKDVNDNIVLMLNLLFPNTYPIQHNITTSFDKYLKQQRSKYRYNRLVKTKQILYGDINTEYAKISTNENISEIIWRNDVINDPLYSNLINQLIEYEYLRKKAIENYNKEIQIIDNRLKTAITDKNSDTYFTYKEFSELKNEKKIYTQDALIKEMNNILKTYMKPVSDDKTQEFDTKVSTMVNYFNSNHIQSTPIISNFNDFDMKFNFKIDENIDLFEYFKTYKSAIEKKDIITGLKTNIETNVDSYDSIKTTLEPTRDTDVTRRTIIQNIKLSTINTLESAENASKILGQYEVGAGSYSQNTVKKNKLSDIVNDIIELYKKVKRIKDNALFEWVGVIVNDTNDTVDKIKTVLTSQIKNLKQDLWNLVQNYYYNKSNSRSSYSQYDSERINSIIDAVTNIRKTYNDINSIHSNIESLLVNINNLRTTIPAVTSVKTKAEKIYRMINEKIGLNLINKYILNAKGILYNYRDFIEKSFSEKDKKIFNNAINEQKYSFFKNTIEAINKKLYQNIESINPNFQNKLKDYLDNKSNHFITDIVNKSYLIENPDKTKPVSISDDLDISVIKQNQIYNRNDSNKNSASYTINVYMELIIGKLDVNTMGNLNCQYKDKDLITRFLELMNKYKQPKLKIRPPFNIENATKEIEKKKKAKEEKIQSANKSTKRNMVKKGGYTRKNTYK